ncbi:hypothetical protein [uncultured Tateyamaria sp.]|uniref:hypothetical protein n=1 Tax=Tateyamaria sp. 1078 TaxID=3417464 RepID=UPI00262B35DB|nr:hypothetical protein [uncultured Tateyamaria sp.]
MKILFHANDLGLRGTAQAIYDYAHFAEALLGHEAMVCYPKGQAETDAGIVAKFAARFPLTEYERLGDIAGSGADLTYFIKYGGQDGLVSPDTPSAIHAVFQAFDPHGASYAYVSEWLALYCTGGRYPHVPHIVTLPPGTSQRDAWGIPEGAFVYGRYGGYDTFDLDFVKSALPQLLTDEDVWCVFVNTAPFIDHPRVLFRDPVTDPVDKSNFILSCDAMIHARKRGESFGLAICEFLFHDRPVLAWQGGKDGNHRTILHPAPGALYRDADDFLAKARDLRSAAPYDWKGLVAPFAPAAVMEQFERVFVSRADPPRGFVAMTRAGFKLRKLLRT